MHRGYVKHWRKEMDSEVWDKPPLYLKLWTWLKLSANRETGMVSGSLRYIAQELTYHENRAQRTPNPGTVAGMLDWFAERGAIAQTSRGTGNAQYRDITLLHWADYQVSVGTANAASTQTANAASTQTANAGQDTPSTSASTELHAKPHGTANAASTQTANAASTQTHLPLQEGEREELSPPRARALDAPGERAQREEPFEAPSLTVVRGSCNPMAYSDAELLPPLPDYDEEALFQHYLREKARHRRHRAVDTDARRMIRVLAGDPHIFPRLTADDLRLILSQWLKSWIPTRCAHMWHVDPKHNNQPYWEVALSIGDWHARKETALRDAQPSNQSAFLAGLIDRQRTHAR